MTGLFKGTKVLIPLQGTAKGFWKERHVGGPAALSPSWDPVQLYTTSLAHGLPHVSLAQ
jgi:hypothetical protein